MGELTGSYIWLLFPIYGMQGSRNAVALEAFSSNQNNTRSVPDQSETEGEVTFSIEGGENQGSKDEDTSANGKATYFFRIASRHDFYLENNEETNRALDSFVKNLNRCMIEINFRREPIFLSEESLDSSKYSQYRFAIAKMPSLRFLRSMFIGRVIHSSLDHWKQDVLSLLDFNSKSDDDNEKWKRGQ